MAERWIQVEMKDVTPLGNAALQMSSLPTGPSFSQ